MARQTAMPAQPINSNVLLPHLSTYLIATSVNKTLMTPTKTVCIKAEPDASPVDLKISGA